MRIDALACYPWFSAYYIKVLQGRRNALDLADGRAKESGFSGGTKRAPGKAQRSKPLMLSLLQMVSEFCLLSWRPSLAPSVFTISKSWTMSSTELPKEPSSQVRKHETPTSDNILEQ